MRRAGIEGVVHMHAIGSTRQLVEHHIRCCRGRIGIGHLEHRHHTAQRRRTRSALKVFLVFITRLTKMHLTVDHTRQHGQPGTINQFARLLRRDRANLHDLSARHPDIGADLATWREYGSIFQDEVECISHAQSPLPF